MDRILDVSPLEDLDAFGVGIVKVGVAHEEEELKDTNLPALIILRQVQLGCTPPAFRNVLSLTLISYPLSVIVTCTTWKVKRLAKSQEAA